MARWSLIGWVIAGIAVGYHLAYAFLLVPFGVYRVPSLYPVISGLSWPALILDVVLTITGIVILIAKFITGLRDRDAGRILGVVIGWVLLLGIALAYRREPWRLLVAAAVALIAVLIHHMNRNSRKPHPTP